jgi:hypothetical protein
LQLKLLQYFESGIAASDDGIGLETKILGIVSKTKDPFWLKFYSNTQVRSKGLPVHKK